MVAEEAARPDPTEPKPLPAIAEKTEGMERRSGLLDFFVDSRGGKLWLALPPATDAEKGLELIYLEGLATGLGSNPVGLDRGQVGKSRLLRLRRFGPRVLFEIPNLKFRALSDQEAERRATAESFATSVIWAQDLAALDADGTGLIDLTPFLLRDARGVARTLADTGQGSYSLETSRSAVDFEHCLAFPDNLELQAVLTWVGDGEGEHVQSTAPVPEAITLVQHLSLVRLPDDDYRPRAFDPRIGGFGDAFRDYAADLDAPVERRYVDRHRLVKEDPSKERSPAVEPLVYYLDPGVPEPVRGALLDGARWWAEAFEAAGFENGFRVEMLPPGVHPLDARYHVIQWVHRSTRGWSYGTTLNDPRTGEVIKGHVNLGSLRVRQDRLLFEGLAGTGKTGSGEPDDPIELSLARIRQLSAHEVGHTLGITHNFAASTYDGRASVMDYPAPLITVGSEGELDFSQAYGVGLGSWDIHTIRYLYSEPAPGVSEEDHLAEIVADGLERGLLFLTDEDARPPGASDPRANLWDNFADATAGLETALAVRRIALSRFGEHNIAPGRPLATLEEVLAPVYFHHRYQLEAAVKTVGGLEYSYALRGDGQGPARWVDAGRQRRALEVILGILEPETLDLPEPVLDLLLPRPFSAPRNREMFESFTWPAFDALGAARTAADQVVAGLVRPERIGRLIDQHRRSPERPGPDEVLGALVAKAFRGDDGASPRHHTLALVVERAVIDRLMVTAAMPRVPPEVRAHLEHTLERIAERLQAGGEARGPERRSMVADVSRFLERREVAPSARIGAAPPPPGSPIGSGGLHTFHGCESMFPAALSGASRTRREE